MRDFLGFLGIRAPRVAVDDLLGAARKVATRSGVQRVPPGELLQRMADGAFVVDIRTPWTRDPEGHVPGAVVIEHTVLFWRLDPQCASRWQGVPDLPPPEYDTPIIVMCNEGYQSSLTAEQLRRLGFRKATDVIDGFRGYAATGGPIEREPTLYVT